MIPAVAIVGRSNSGKTTLIERLIQEFRSRGYSIGAIKHTDKPIQLDVEGKDSCRFTRAGCRVTMLVSSAGLTLFDNSHVGRTVEEALALMPDCCDLILVEGYKNCNLSRIEVCDNNSRQKLVCPPEELMAIVSDHGSIHDVPTYTRNDVKGIADLIEGRLLKE